MQRTSPVGFIFQNILSAALIGGILLLVISTKPGGKAMQRIFIGGRAKVPCESRYKDRRPTPEELVEVVREHQAWLESEYPPSPRDRDKRRANLCGDNLQGADLREADFQQANLSGADLAGAVFAPRSLPDLRFLAEADNLDMMTFHNSPAALVALREAFKKAGMRTQERQITYVIEHTEMLLAWDPSWFARPWRDSRPWREKLAGKGESLFDYVLFELLSGYGMVPRRALATLGLLLLLFSCPYMVAVTVRGPAGIWMVWLPDRVHKAEGEAAPVCVTSTFLFPPLQMWAAGRWRSWCDFDVFAQVLAYFWIGDRCSELLMLPPISAAC
jgi:hypothetical protein